jgi:hypothetical protein
VGESIVYLKPKFGPFPALRTKLVVRVSFFPVVIYHLTHAFTFNTALPNLFIFAIALATVANRTRGQNGGR